MGVMSVILIRIWAIKPDVTVQKGTLTYPKRDRQPGIRPSSIRQLFRRCIRSETNVALKIMDREVDGVSVVALDGRIVLGEESNVLREKLKSLIAEGKKKIVLNMDNLTYSTARG